ncbi:MAG: hypothetical protein HYY06_11510 [Deltaproteobacteria bacterium]|nr:hypothetical protein [Deltaproteobacteria bacterium]
MGRKRKRRGHFCWCCEQVLANERFSGGGHARHVCRGCAKLGAAELGVRQEIRNIHRLLRHHTIIPRKLRPQFARYLAHPNERVRRYAEELAARSDQERDLLRRLREEEEAALEAYERLLFATERAIGEDPPPWGECADPPWGDCAGDDAWDLPEDTSWEQAPDPPDAAEAWPVAPAERSS